MEDTNYSCPQGGGAWGDTNGSTLQRGGEGRGTWRHEWFVSPRRGFPLSCCTHRTPSRNLSVGCPVGAQVKTVKVFLNANPDYIKDTVHIKGVKDSDGQSCDVFAVMMGFGRMLQNYPAGSRPNVQFEFEPSRGFNSGALTLVAKNRNSSGISRSKELYIDRSLNQITGTLDSFFQSQAARKGRVVEPRGVLGPLVGEVREEERVEEPEPLVEKPIVSAQLSTASAAVQSTPKAWSLLLPDMGFSFSLCGNHLMVSNSNPTNKNFPKHMLLAEWLDGEVPRRSDRAARVLGPPRCVWERVCEPSRRNV